MEAEEKREQPQSGDTPVLDRKSRLTNQVFEKRHEHEINQDIDRKSRMIVASSKAQAVTLDSFEIGKQVGKGTFGRVFVAKLRGTDKRYAIKAIRKDKLLKFDVI